MPEGTNAFLIKPGVRINTPAFVAFAGPSGSGKTRSALELASGLAGDNGKILVADTEGNRALHYADLYHFDHVEWRPPFTPESNAELIDLAEQRGYAVLIIDSESDEYEGEGGLQEIRDTTKDEFWAKTKARHKHALINRMRRAKVHIIFCLRAEERVRISKIDGKTVVEPLGWMPICEKRFLYEVQSSFLFRPATREEPDAPGKPQPIKLYDIHARFFPSDQRVTREAGRLLAEWCAGGAPAPTYQPTIEEQAREAAKGGMKSLENFWRGLSRHDQRTLKPALDTIKDEAAAYDEPEEEDPFGLPPVPTEQAPGDDRPEQPQPIADEARSPAGAEVSLPQLGQHRDGKPNWTAWAAAMVAAIREASRKQLAALGEHRRAHLIACPATAMADIERAYDERARELRGGEAA